MKTENTKKQYILYILVRNDLPSLNAGKAMAQASHASNAFVKNASTSKAAKEWANETDQGFGTVIVLSVNEEQLRTAINEDSHLHDVIADIVVDPTYPYIVNKEIADLINPTTHTVPPIVKNDGSVVLHRKETTCGYVFGTKESCKPVVGNLQLHP